MKKQKLTHFNKEGRARMIDVGEKKDTLRIAIAEGEITMQPSTIKMIKDRKISKGDVLGVAQVAGIMAAKKTSEIIPMCHPLLLTSININFEINEEEIVPPPANFNQFESQYLRGIYRHPNNEELQIILNLEACLKMNETSSGQLI